MYDIAKKIKNEHGDQKKGLRDLMKSKTGLVTWVVTNCDYTEGSKKRMNLVQKLFDKGLNIDRRLVYHERK